MKLLQAVEEAALCGICMEVPATLFLYVDRLFDNAYAQFFSTASSHAPTTSVNPACISGFSTNTGISFTSTGFGFLYPATYSLGASNSPGLLRRVFETTMISPLSILAQHASVTANPSHLQTGHSMRWLTHSGSLSSGLWKCLRPVHWTGPSYSFELS